MFADVKLLTICAISVFVVATPARCDDKPLPTLVRAKVTKVSETETKGTTIASLEVIHVYSGDADLKGRTFRDSRRTTGGSGGPTARAAFNEDEESLYTVRLEKGELRWVMDDRMPFLIRSRKADNPHHAEVVKLAEVIETIERAKADNRPSLLRDRVADPTPEVAAWVVAALGRSNSAVADKWFDGFAVTPETKLPLAAQVAADECLCKQRAEKWSASEPRYALLRSWVAGKLDLFHLRLVMGRLDMAEQTGELRNDKAVGLLIAAAENPDWEWAHRREAMYYLGIVAQRAVDHQRAFDWFFEQTKENRELTVRRAAAESVARFPLYPKRLEAVEEHLATEKDEKVAETLRAAVKKAKADK